MGDITSPTLLYIKGGLFLLLGILAVGGMLFMFPDLRLAALLAIAIWAFCRAYYFIFYVIQQYVDPSYKFAGLIDFARYVLRRR